MRIIVIGGGISGLSAARKLYSANLRDVLILEATDRLGGRIRTSDDHDEAFEDGIKVDLGATWIHGSQNNPVYLLAKEAGLLESNQQTSGKSAPKKRTRRKRVLHLGEDGSEIPVSVVSEVHREYDKVTQEAEKCFIGGMPNGLCDIGVETYFWNALKEYFAGYTGKQLSDRQRIFEHRQTWETSLSGCHSMEEVSTLQFGSYQELAGHHPRIPGGFSSIVKHMTSSLPKDRILLNHAVVNINWESQDKNGIQVECENGAIFTCDIVINSSSLGHLKKFHTYLFSPSLPRTKQQCIEKLGIGTVDKVFIIFDDLNFLPEDVQEIDLMWDRSCVESKSTEDVWTRKVYYVVVDPFHPNTLTGWITGKEAEYMETLPDAQIAREFCDILRKFLKDDTIPIPRKIVTSRWYSNPYTRGSYSYIPVGATLNDVEGLVEPVCDRSGQMRLLFAGEATHSQFYSTTHGALLSGEREAERIINMSQQQAQKN